MGYTVNYHAEDGYIALTLDGQIDFSIANAITADVLRVVQDNDCYLILSDYRAATLKVSTLDIYDLPKLIASVAAPAGVEAHRLKRAVVIPGSMENRGFFEAVSRNRSQQVRVFYDYDEAREWLLGS